MKALQQHGVQLTIFALHYPYRKDEFQWHGVRVVPLNGRNKAFTRLFFLKRRLEAAFSAIHSQQPFSRIHACWLNEATVWGVSLGKKYGLSVTATAMGQDVLATNAYLKNRAIGNVDKIITLSPFHQQTLQQNGYGSEMIPWGLPEGQDFPVEKTVDLIGVGNLIPLKNYAYFLEICAELKTLKPDLKAVIVGTGPEKKQLEQRIRELQLKEHVRLVGQLTYDETREWIASATVLVHPSHFESFGMVVIEALAAGVVVFARNTGIAASEPFVTVLTGNREADSKQIVFALNHHTPRLAVYPVSVTVTAYLEKIWKESNLGRQAQNDPRKR